MISRKSNRQFLAGYTADLVPSGLNAITQECISKLYLLVILLTLLTEIANWINFLFVGEWAFFKVTKYVGCFYKLRIMFSYAEFPFKVKVGGCIWCTQWKINSMHIGNTKKISILLLLLFVSKIQNLLVILVLLWLIYVPLLVVCGLIFQEDMSE